MSPTLPFQYNIEGIFYNKKMFAEQGIKVPQSWDELVAAATKLKAAGVQPFTAGGKSGWPVSRWIGAYLFRSLGGDAMAAVANKTAKLTDPGYVAAAQAIQDLAKPDFPVGVARRISRRRITTWSRARPRCSTREPGFWPTSTTRSRTRSALIRSVSCRSQSSRAARATLAPGQRTSAARTRSTPSCMDPRSAPG